MPRHLALGTSGAIVAAYPALRDLLAGRGPLLLPVAATTPQQRGARPTRTPYLRTVTGAAVGTSGSTGAPKRAVLPIAALRASIDATHERLGGPGRWVLALPAYHIAGLQVVLRSLAAGPEPALLPDEGPFAARFADAASDLSGRWYTSLVPAQLGPLLQDAAATAALGRAAAVLCGGAALPDPVRARAAAAGIALVSTYGMSETAGGCVYDGSPLAGVGVRFDEGRILLGGPTVAAGYLDDPQRSARVFLADADGTPWFATDDLGELAADGTLAVQGRRDDVIITGGYKVHPAVVEAVLTELLPPGSQVAVVGVPHPRWGEALVAAFATPSSSDDARDDGASAPVDRTDRLRPGLRERLPRYAVPQRVVQLPALPLIGPGKVERAALAEELATPHGERPTQVEQ